MHQDLLKQSKSSHARGVTAVEMLFGISIVGIILVFAMNAIQNYINSAKSTTEKTQALYLAEEGLELMRFVRDQDWSTFSAIPENNPRYLSIGSTTISLTTTPEIVDGFVRTITVSNVYRDSNDDIVASTTVGSVADANTRYVTATITWGSPTTTTSLTSILADIRP
jgi:type II secretory pathway pseudopilin PulG